MTLKENSNHIISEKLAIKNTLMNELADWIKQKNLKQTEAAEILGISRPCAPNVHQQKIYQIYD